MKITHGSGGEELEHASGSVLTPVRWAVLLGMLVSLSLPLGREVVRHRAGVLSVVALYALAIASVPYLNGQHAPHAVRVRLLLAADLLFSAAILLLTGGLR